MLYCDRKFKHKILDVFTNLLFLDGHVSEMFNNCLSKLLSVRPGFDLRNLIDAAVINIVSRERGEKQEQEQLTLITFTVQLTVQ